MTRSAAPPLPDLRDSQPNSEPEITTAPAPTMDENGTAADAFEVLSGQGHFVGNGGVQLFEQWWKPQNPKAAVVVVHGYSEHSSRYAHVAETFVKHGYAVYSYDHRSHGQSDGKNTFISSFDDVVDELGLFIKQVESRVAELPLFILGHSMGGLITSLYMATRQPSVRGVILTGPYVQVNDDVPAWLVSVAGLVGKLFPRLPTIGLDYKLVSRDPEILNQHQADPLIYRGKLPARTGAEMNLAIQKINQSMEKITAPLLVMHGGGDQIAPVNGSQRIFDRASNEDKTLKIYDGLYHEILNEVEREEVKADIVTWMDERVGS